MSDRASGGDAMLPFAGTSETHSAVVFFCGDRAYKLKKPVRLDFLDFSSAEARAAACARETELNRRFAPDVYLGVAEVRGPAGEVCDHLVVMRRMPDMRRLSALVQDGAPVDAAVRQVARILAAQHAAAARDPQIGRQGRRDATRQRWHDNLVQLRTIGRELPGDSVDEIEGLADQFLAGREPLFDARIRDGRVVDGHGDLLAGDIFCLDDGPRILDCLDFDDRLRWVDGLDDAAFLAMDLEQLGAPHLAGQFVGWYTEYSGDHAPPSLRHHYTAYRAVVRAKVDCVRAGQGDPSAAGQARQLTAAALRHLRAGRVTLTLVGGLPGTGKSSLAGTVGDRLGCVVLSSDRIRKELAGLDPNEPVTSEFGTGIYATAHTDRSYAELLDRAARLLSMGESVVLDATWSSAAHRQVAMAIAAQERAEPVQLECTAPQPVAAARMAARRDHGSDATAAIAARMADQQAPWPEATVIDTGGADDHEGIGSAAVQMALDAIRPHGHEHVWRPVRPYMLPG
jgi:aminoglycoside phosphotransferase family enzyme/predicted kinase